jgi:carboxymethylenebutenolidase
MAIPPTGVGPPVLVLHAWWGLNDTIKEFCKKLARAGFVVFAPDLYHGKVAVTIPEAEHLGSALDAGHLGAEAEIAEAASFLNQRAASPEGGLAVVGFSMGAYYALHLSNAHPELVRDVVVFYGTGAESFDNARASYQGHFAETDEFEPPANVDHLEATLKSAGRPVEFYRYAGAGHWFFEPDRVDAFVPEAARLAWERTVAFLSRHEHE